MLIPVLNTDLAMLMTKTVYPSAESCAPRSNMLQRRNLQCVREISKQLSEEREMGKEQEDLRSAGTAGSVLSYSKEYPTQTHSSSEGDEKLARAVLEAAPSFLALFSCRSLLHSSPILQTCSLPPNWIPLQRSFTSMLVTGNPIYGYVI